MSGGSLRRPHNFQVVSDSTGNGIIGFHSKDNLVLWIKRLKKDPFCDFFPKRTTSFFNISLFLKDKQFFLICKEKLIWKIFILMTFMIFNCRQSRMWTLEIYQYVRDVVCQFQMHQCFTEKAAPCDQPNWTIGTEMSKCTFE